MRLLQEDDDTDYIKVGEVQLIGLDNSMTSKRGVVTMARYRESGISCPSASWESIVARELSS